MERNIINQIHYNSYLQYRNLQHKLAIFPLALLVIDKQQTIFILETPENKSGQLFSLNIGNKKIVNYCFKTSPIKPVAIEYALMLIQDELNAITNTCPSKHKLICQNSIVDQIATICGIEQGKQRLLPLNKLEKLFKSWKNNSSNTIIYENCIYDNETIIATILLLKTIMHYLKCDIIYIMN